LRAADPERIDGGAASGSDPDPDPDLDLSMRGLRLSRLRLIAFVWWKASSRVAR